MKITIRCSIAVLLVLLVALPLLAQGDRGGERNVPGNTASSSGTASIASRGVAVNSSSSTQSVSVSRDYSSGSPTYTGSGSIATSRSTPRLEGTSYTSPTAYYIWQDYYWFLRMNYGFNPYYFTRFTRNREPLITPQILKLTLRGPMKASFQMLAAIGQLEMMLRDAKAGKQIGKQELAAKSLEIRELAKEIRQNQTLSYIDIRKEKTIYREDNTEILSLESVARLREMATNLSDQLSALYNQSSTSTVSVDNFNQPSLGSLAKGIEKLSKAIESSSRRL